MIHHLDRLGSAGLVVRTRDPENRRLQGISLTAAGDAFCFLLRDAAVAFDHRLRTGISDAETTELRRLLTALHDNVATTQPTTSSRSEHPHERSNP